MIEIIHLPMFTKRSIAQKEFAPLLKLHIRPEIVSTWLLKQEAPSPSHWYTHRSMNLR